MPWFIGQAKPARAASASASAPKGRGKGKGKGGKGRGGGKGWTRPGIQSGSRDLQLPIRLPWRGTRNPTSKSSATKEATEKQEAWTPGIHPGLWSLLELLFDIQWLWNCWNLVQICRKLWHLQDWNQAREYVLSADRGLAWLLPSIVLRFPWNETYEGSKKLWSRHDFVYFWNSPFWGDCSISHLFFCSQL